MGLQWDIGSFKLSGYKINSENIFTTKESQRIDFLLDEIIENPYGLNTQNYIKEFNEISEKAGLRAENKKCKSGCISNKIK